MRYGITRVRGSYPTYAMAPYVMMHLCTTKRTRVRTTGTHMRTPSTWHITARRQSTSCMYSLLIIFQCTSAAFLVDNNIPSLKVEYSPTAEGGEGFAVKLRIVIMGPLRTQLRRIVALRSLGFIFAVVTVVVQLWRYPR